MARFKQGSGRRTDYEWFAVGDVLNAIDPGAAAQFLGTFSTLTIAATLMRVRGRAYGQIDPGAAAEQHTILLGIGIFTTDAVAAGVAPEFQVDGGTVEYNWLWTGALFVSGLNQTSEGLASSAASDRIEIDSKAMRKLKPNEVVAMVVEAPAALAVDQGGTSDLMVRYRVLIGS